MTASDAALMSDAFLQLALAEISSASERREFAVEEGINSAEAVLSRRMVSNAPRAIYRDFLTNDLVMRQVQKDLLADLLLSDDDDESHIPLILIAARRFGKDLCFIECIVRKDRERRVKQKKKAGLSKSPKYLYIAPNTDAILNILYSGNRLADNIPKQFLKKIVTHPRVIFHLRSGGEIHFMPADRTSGKNLRGGEYGGLCITEGSLFYNLSEVFRAALPGVFDKGESGFAWINSTTDPKSELYWRYIAEIKSGKRDWRIRVFKGDSYMSKEKLNRLRSTLGEKTFLREIMCDESVVDDTSIFGDELMNTYTDPEVQYIPGEPVYVGIDIGYTDATAMCFAQCVADRWTLFYYYECTGRHIEYYIRFLRELNFEYGKIILPHDAAQNFASNDPVLGNTYFQFTAAGFDTLLLPRQCRKRSFGASGGEEWAQINNITKPFIRACRFGDDFAEGLTRLKQFSEIGDDGRMHGQIKFRDKCKHAADSIRYLSRYAMNYHGERHSWELLRPGYQNK